MVTQKTKRKAAKKSSNPGANGKALKRVAAKKNHRKNVTSAAKSAAKKTLKQIAAAKKNAKKIAAKKTHEPKIRGKAGGAELTWLESPSKGPDTGGQSGDTQGLSGVAETDSESVKELLEEGQAYEAEVVGGVESVPDADQGEVRTHEVPQDDVPDEYTREDAQK
jgi:hypothetical protein